MACNPCCVCIGGVNYTIACRCAPCGGNSLAMSTNNPNPAVSQSPGGVSGDGGAGALSCILNGIGKWGSVITAQVQGRPVATGCGVRIGAKGSTTLSGVNSGSMVLILIVIVALVLLATRKG